MISTNEDQLLVLSSLIVVVLFYIDLKIKLWLLVALLNLNSLLQQS
jgi:hypothetical protein